MPTQKITYKGEVIDERDVNGNPAIFYDGKIIGDVLVDKPRTLQTEKKVAKTNIMIGSAILACESKAITDDIEVLVERGVDPILENNSWEQISKIAQKGEGANYWSVGDKKAVVVNGTFGSVTLSNVTYYAFILGFNHNEAIEGKGVHFGCFKTSAGVDIVFNGFAMYSSQTNYNGWGGSLMRNTYCPAFLACLPAELQKVITECPKYTDNMGGTSTNAVYVTATSDKIFIPAEWEVYGKRTYAHPTEQSYQKQYDYFAAGNSTIRYNHSAVSSARQWWIRSPLKQTSSNSFVMSYTNGVVSGTTSNSTIGFFPCFKV